ncbi:MAG: hypothetical protein ACOX3K_04055 [Bacilli bacterium]
MKSGHRFIVSNREYRLVKLLGRGKGGYSYLVESDQQYYVLKQIHHEPCDYYHFGNKIEAEIHDYHRLLKTDINIPKMIDVDREKEIIIKEYIPGPTIAELILAFRDVSLYIQQLEKMLPALYSTGLNLDYYPTNFVVNAKDNQIYYIDYECNEYDPKWNFVNWGKKYWTGEAKIK